MAGSVLVALFLALEGWPPGAVSPAILPLTAMAFCSAATVFPLAGFYQRHTRSTSLRDITIISQGAALAILLEAVVAKMAPETRGVQFSVYVIQFLIAVPAVGALRIVARRRELMRKRSKGLAHQGERIPALLIGTGANCDLFVRSLRHSEAKLQAVGIIDDVQGTLGLFFHEVKILGSLRDPKQAIAAIEAAEIQPKRILLTEPMTQFDSEGLQELISWAGRKGISVARLPGLGERDFTYGESGATQLHNVDHEHILNRPQKAIERSLLRKLLEGRRVLITGAGGSIGSELTRQIAAFDPAMLVLIDNCEFNAYSIDLDLSQHFPGVPRQVYVASVRDGRRIETIFRRHRPELVFHAAALKHVPMVEMNPCEGVLTNVIGTRNIADAARNVEAIAMIQVSTDKAVNASSVMGATKRVAEFYVQAQDRITAETEEPTRFLSVRFGNVLGSSGSLIPLFQRQISEGGPLTVTDPRMERFFMTIREAVELTLVAAARALAQRAGLGEIFVLDMGAPVRIVDLAERMIRLAGLEPHKDIGIEFIGVRPGEKLFEELFDEAEQRRDSGIAGVSSAVPDGIPIGKLRAAIWRLEMAAESGEDAIVRRLLRDLVPGYWAASLRTTEANPCGMKVAQALSRPSELMPRGRLNLIAPQSQVRTQRQVGQ
jgi:FlaA1/EpsC-like NDP-sugar epimerase